MRHIYTVWRVLGCTTLAGVGRHRSNWVGLYGSAAWYTTQKRLWRQQRVLAGRPVAW